MNFSGMEDLDCTWFLLLLFATHSVQKHSFHPCSCVSGSSHNDIFLFVFAHWSIGWAPYSMLSWPGVMWWVSEKSVVTGCLAAQLPGNTRLCVVQGSFICAGKLPPCLTSERTASQAWRGCHVWPGIALLCPSVSVFMRPLLSGSEGGDGHLLAPVASSTYYSRLRTPITITGVIQYHFGRCAQVYLLWAGKQRE